MAYFEKVFLVTVY